MLEPYLIQQAYLQRTCAAASPRRCYQHSGVTAPRIGPTGNLWDKLPPG